MGCIGRRMLRLSWQAGGKEEAKEEVYGCRQGWYGGRWYDCLSLWFLISQMWLFSIPGLGEDCKTHAPYFMFCIFQLLFRSTGTDKTRCTEWTWALWLDPCEWSRKHSWDHHRCAARLNSLWLFQKTTLMNSWFSHTRHVSHSQVRRANEFNFNLYKKLFLKCEWFYSIY